MSRKIWIAIIAIGVMGSLIAGAGVAALILVPRYRDKHNIAQARKLAAEGEWDLSRRHYQEYLFKNDDDIQALEEYIDVCEVFTVDRRRSLLAAGRAYIKLAQREPENASRKQDVLDFYKKYRFWPELEYAISLFHGADRDALSDEMAYERAVAVESQGRDSSAVDEFEAYLGLEGPRKDAPMLDAPLRLARLYRKQGKERDATRLFESLINEHPDNGMLHAYHASYLMDSDLQVEARDALARVPVAARNNLDYYLTAARLAILERKNEDAIQFAERALEFDSDNVDAHLNYTMALERSGRRDEAVEHIEAMDPLYRLDTPGFMMFLIEIKLDEGNVEDADAIRDVYVRAYPDQRFLDEYLKGRIAFAEGRNDSKMYRVARDHFALATEMNPNLDRARYFLAVTELELDDKGAARIALETYLRNNPGDEQARRLWSRNFDAAKSLLELRYSGQRLLESENPDLTTLIYTAQDLMAHHREEDLKLTQDLLEHAITIAPGDPQGYSALAAFYLDRDRVDEAEVVLGRAVSAGVDRASFPLLDANILLSRGDVEAASRIAKTHLADKEFSEVRTWTSFFSRHGFLREGTALLEDFLGREGEKSAEVVLPFQLSLTLRFGTQADAGDLVERAQGVLSDTPEGVKTLNEMRLVLARSMMAQKPMDGDAIESLLKAVEESDSEEDGLIVERARLSLNKELPDFENAMSTLSAISADSSAYDAAQMLLAEIAYRRGRYEEVVTIANQIIERSGEDTSALYLLAEAFVGMRQLENAQSKLERIVEIDRGDLRAIRLLVRVYTDLQLPQRADAMLRRYEEITGRDSGAQGSAVDLRAYVAQSKGELEESEAQLRDALAASPDDFAALTGLVRALASQGKYEEGIQLVESYLERNPNHADAWVFLGQVILDQGENADLSKASTAFTRAQIAVPELSAAQLGQIDLQIRTNNIDLAISMCRRYLKNHPDDSEVLFRLASMLSRTPNGMEEALTTIQRAIEVGERPEFVRLRAYIYTRVGRANDAIADIERLKSLMDRTTPDDDLTLAEAYIELGQLDKARDSVAAARSKFDESAPRLVGRANTVEARIATPEANQ